MRRFSLLCERKGGGFFVDAQQAVVFPDTQSRNHGAIGDGGIEVELKQLKIVLNVATSTTFFIWFPHNLLCFGRSSTKCNKCKG